LRVWLARFTNKYSMTRISLLLIGPSGEQSVSVPVAEPTPEATLTHSAPYVPPVDPTRYYRVIEQFIISKPIDME
jgi:hypothetical protein